MRPTDEIRNELQELSERRSRAWELARQGAPRPDEIRALTRRIDELWAELRRAESGARYGSRELIMARAKAEQLLEAQLRRLTAAPRPVRRLRLVAGGDIR